MAGSKQSIGAVFFFRDVANAEDRRCDSGPETVETVGVVTQLVLPKVLMRAWLSYARKRRCYASERNSSATSHGSRTSNAKSTTERTHQSPNRTNRHDCSRHGNHSPGRPGTAGAGTRNASKRRHQPRTHANRTKPTRNCHRTLPRPCRRPAALP